MTRTEVEELLRYVAAVYSRFPTDDARIDAWYSLLRLHEYEYAQRATRRWCSTERRTPTPADIIEGIRDAAKTEHGRPGRRLEGARCAICGGDGFVEMSPQGRSTVKPCPNGCLAPLPGSAHETRPGPGLDAVRQAAHVRTARDVLDRVEVPGGRGRRVL